jgi:hypothetical protein
MGELFDKQDEFSDDLCDLIAHIRQVGRKKSLREVYRTEEQENIYRKTGASALPPGHPSDHEFGLAGDLFICDEDGVPSDDFNYLLPFAVFWESLRPGNYWGGRWKNPYDPQHFGRRHDK